MSFAESKSAHRPRGFTLVELLVVMVIIGLLMAMLLVSLTKWRETTRKTWCRVNLHQIGIAMHSYQTDFDGVAVMSGRHPWQWGNAGGLPDRRYANADELWHKNYMTDVSIMRCPSIFEHGLQRPSLFFTVTDEEIIGDDWRFEEGGARTASGQEDAPYWLYGVSLGISPLSAGFSTPKIYWVRPDQIEDTLQVQVQDAAVQSEPVENNFAFLERDQSNHAVMTDNLTKEGVVAKTWRAEGANALHIDGSAAWYQLPRVQKITNSPHGPDAAGHNKVDNGWPAMGLYSAGGGTESVGRLMIPGSSSMVDWGHSYRGNPATFWKSEKLFGFGPIRPNYEKPVAGYYDKRNLNWNP